MSEYWFDKEYPTDDYDEMMYLKQHGVRYEWVKKNEHGISVWKYKKTKELFENLMNYYSSLKY